MADPGGAVEAMWPEAERIRCWVHKMRKVLDKVPGEAWPLLKPHLQAIGDAPDVERCRRLVAEVVERFEREHPSAKRRVQEDLEASLAHLRPPAAHRKPIRTTNLAERSFEEERRGAKVIPRFRSERECLKERCIEERQRPRAGQKQASAAGTVA